MGRPLKYIIGITAILLFVTLAAWWYWHTWPARQLASARSAVEAGDYERAESLLRPLLPNPAKDPDVPYLHAQTLRHLKRYTEAEKALVKARDCGLGDASVMRELALLLAPGDWPPEAEGILQKVARDNPDDREVVRTLAEGYARRGRWKEASRLYSRLVELQPGDADTLFQRGIARMRDSYFTLAIDDFHQVLAKVPDHFLARLYLAHSLQSEARMDEAEVELQRCRKARPELAEPLVGLANCAVEKGDLKAAEGWLNQAVSLDRTSPLVLHEVVNLHLRRARYDLAREGLEVLVNLVPNDKQVHLKLAQVYQRQGNLERASQHQRRFQELDALEDKKAQGMR